MNTQQTDLNTPWSLHIEQDGTEDIAVICDADGYDLVRSETFWWPQEGDPIPPTLAAILLMASAPKLLDALIAASDWIDTQIGQPRTKVQALIQEAIAEATGRVA